MSQTLALAYGGIAALVGLPETSAMDRPGRPRTLEVTSARLHALETPGERPSRSL